MLHPFMGINDWDRIGCSVEESTCKLQKNCICRSTANENTIGAYEEILIFSKIAFQLPLESTRDSRFKKTVTKFKDIETTAAEAVAFVHFASVGKPWAFYFNTARHLWDEVRHSWFGEAALRNHGYDIYEAPNWTAWYDMSRSLFNLEDVYIHLTIRDNKKALQAADKTAEMRRSFMAQYQR